VQSPIPCAITHGDESEVFNDSIIQQLKNRRGNIMRVLFPLTAALAMLLAVSPTFGDETNAAKTTIDKAVKAIGGADVVSKQTNSEWSEKGTYYGMGQPVPYEGKYTFSLPTKSRMEIVGVFLIVIDGDKGWMRSPAGVVKLDAEALKEQKQMLHIGYVTSLIPFAKGEKGYNLKATDDTEVNGEACAAVTCERTGFRSIKLEVNKKTNLLMRATYVVLSQEQGNKEVTEEAFYLNWKKEDGLLSPRKMLVHRDGKKFIESNPSNVKHPEKIDAALFAEPK
jgi:hypothetical protein